MHGMSATDTSATDLPAWLAALYAPGLGARLLETLREELGSMQAIVGASAERLHRHGVSEAMARALRRPDLERTERDLRWLDGPGRGLITLDDPRYPALLRCIDDPPIALFYAGNPEILRLPQLAIVGSRNPTASGRDTAEAFARHLSECGLSIVSGLATGIDGAAHRGALKGSGHTVAICGTGLDQVYPPSHRDLAGRIAASGVLMSEYGVGTPPIRYHFPRRNRIISGLAVGTLVVEAARKSGSLITAHQATAQGREVFAVPGSIHNPLARGCHQLLREGAKLVESAQDILSELGALVEAHTTFVDEEDESSHVFDDDGDYQKLLDSLDFDPIDMDTLIQRTGLTADALSSMLLILELQGRVLAVSGGRFVRSGEG
jgi:DNA processing protein